MAFPPALLKLIQELAKLPGVGRRSAERMAFGLLRDRENLIDELQRSLQDVRANLVLCSRCGSVTTKSENPCKLCTDPRRDDAMVCVVENPEDILLMEKAGGYRGRYHALLGKISPMNEEGIGTIRIDLLLQRLKEGKIKEVVLALNADTESDATASFLQEAIAPMKIRVTRLARGIPTGSGLAYSDSTTLSKAFEGRH